MQIPGLSSYIKHDGKRRRDHEQLHNPPPVIPDVVVSDSDTGNQLPVPSKRDDAYNYNCCLLSFGLLFTEFLDAIAEGNGDRNLRCWKMFILHFKKDTGSNKYAIEALYYSRQVNSLLTPRWVLCEKGDELKDTRDRHNKRPHQKTEDVRQKVRWKIFAFFITSNVSVVFDQ